MRKVNGKNKALLLKMKKKFEQKLLQANSSDFCNLYCLQH